MCSRQDFVRKGGARVSEDKLNSIVNSRWALNTLHGAFFDTQVLPYIHEVLLAMEDLEVFKDALLRQDLLQLLALPMAP